MRDSGERRRAVIRGARSGLPIALGYLPIAIAFGMLARGAGLSVAQAAGMSAFVYAGASQFASLSLIQGGSSAAAIGLATLVLNFRHFLMSASLAQKIRTGWASSLLLGFGITDETYVVATLDETTSPPFFLGLALVAYLSWNAGTLIGAAYAPLLPPFLARGMGVGLYAMFIAILVPGARKAWINGAVAATGGLAAWGLSRLFPSLPFGFRIVIAILTASAIGAAAKKEE